MNNKLFCTFSTKVDIDQTIAHIANSYSISNNRIYVLESPQSEEYICTYNVDGGNISSLTVPNTIMVHRKKETNTLYTINALNSLIKKLNEGKLDNSFIITWNDFRNTVLLTQGISDLRKLDTKVHKIVSLPQKN